MDPLFKCKEQKAYGSSRLEDQRQSSSPLGGIVKVYSGKDSKEGSGSRTRNLPKDGCVMD